MNRLALMLRSRVREQFQIVLPPRRMSEVPTVAGLAERVETVRWLVQLAPISADILDSCELGEL